MMNITEILVDIPLSASILLKITALLGISWFLHFILLKRNPRWRVLLWRCAIMGLLLIPALVPFAYLQVSIIPPPEHVVNAPSKPTFQHPIIETPSFSSPQSAQISQPVLSEISPPSFSLIDWLQANIWIIVSLVWASIATILILRLLMGFLKIKQKITSSLPAPAHLQQLLDRVTEKMDSTKKVTLRYSPDTSTPFLTGLFSPIIILPERMIAGKYENEMPAIFAHEVAHLKSQDLLWILITRCFEVALWFHPLVWKLRDSYSAACEEVCDAVAADYIGDTKSYSSTLAHIALELVGKVPVGSGIPMARSSEIVARLRILKQRFYPTALARRWVILSGLVTLFTLAVIGGLNLVYAESDANKSATRVIHFPKDRSLGTIKIRDLNDKPSRFFDWEFLYQWDVFAQAKGDVIVPKDKKLALIINKEAAKDLSPLSLLEPDIFHVLSLYNSDANDETLQHIVNLNGLEQLNLVGTKITDDGMKQLVKLKSLKRLHLGNTTIGDDGIANISEMSLEFIHLWRTPITDQALRHLSKIKTLKGITFWLTDIGDPGLTYLKDLNHLKGLSLSETKITDKGLANLEKLTDLEYLSLFGTAVSDLGVEYLSNLKSLKHLDLSGTNVSDKGLELLTSLSSLEEVMLPDHGSITDKGLASISKIGSLKKLTLSGEFTDQGLTHLFKLKNLEQLRINAHGITDDGMQHIAKITSLKLLWIQHASVSDNGLEKLKSLNKLEELLFSNNRSSKDPCITSDGLRHLQQFPNLKQLYLYNIKVNQSGLKHLGALTKLEELTIEPLVISDNTLKVDETELRHLSKLNNLKNLHLSNIQITDNGMKYLSDLTSLEELNIFTPKPQITDEGLKYLVDNKKLKRLIISALITDDGLKSLAELKSLESIHLYDATVTQESLDQLYAQLPSLQTVKLQSRVSSEKKPKVGQLAPDFEVTTINGDKFRLSEHRGKYVLVHFWATWCSPCIKSIPMLKDLHAELSEKNKNFVLISLSSDWREQTMRDFIEENSLTWPQAWINLREDIKRQYGVVGVPKYFLIDPDGKIIHSNHCFDELKIAIIEVLQ